MEGKIPIRKKGEKASTMPPGSQEEKSGHLLCPMR